MSGSNLSPDNDKVNGNPEVVKLTGRWPQIIWVNPLTGYQIVDTATTDGEKILQAADKVIVFNHLDAGTCNERIDTIVTSSAVLGLTLTETFTYNLVNGKHIASGVTQVVA